MDRLVRHEVKAVETAKDAKGEFEALVAVFSNIDSYGDRLMPGAFQKSLDEIGFPRLVWSHQWSIPPIGTTLSAKETEDGLVVKGQLFVDQGIELVDHIYAGMAAKNGDGLPPLREFSFGYDVTESRWIKTDEPDAAEFGGEVRELTGITCFEAGPCLVGVNPDTELLAVKGIPAPMPGQPQAAPAPTPDRKGKPDRNTLDRLVTVLTGRPAEQGDA